MKMLSESRRGVFFRASISSVCNFNCRYCAKDLGMENHTPHELNAGLLNAEQYVRNLNLIARHGFKIISFTGGEPLLNPDFEQIASGCRDAFEVIEITTNGTRIKEHLDALRKYVDVLKISVDAVNPDLAVRIAGNDSAADTLNVVEACCKAGIKTVGLNFVYMKQNSAELPKLIEFAAELRKKYGTEIYISVLDLYYSPGNREFWSGQFADLSPVRERLAAEGFKLNRRERIGCDSYNYMCDDVRVNMKDSISRTHRAAFCDSCFEYCQEGIYSLKHSASGWLSVCPSNDLKLGSLLGAELSEVQAHEIIDRYVDILNDIKISDNSGKIFAERHGL